MDPTARDCCERLRALHHEPDPLLLPCVWDVVSAKLYEESGFQAVGTTSAGIAATYGLPDGQRIGIDATVQAIRRIAAHVDIPVSADIEAGYAEDADGVARAALAVIDAGASGLNIEDSLSGCGIDHYAELFDTTQQCDKVEAIREGLDRTGIPAVINARTDTLLLDHGKDVLAAVDRAITRGNAYLRAGADCVFVPDMGNLNEIGIERLVRGIDGPVNLIAGDHTPPVARLRELGVARLSFGPRAMRTALWHLQEMAREWLNEGTYSRMLEGELDYDTVNNWFSTRSEP